MFRTGSLHSSIIIRFIQKIWIFITKIHPILPEYLIRMQPWAQLRFEHHWVQWSHRRSILKWQNLGKLDMGRHWVYQIVQTLTSSSAPGTKGTYCLPCSIESPARLPMLLAVLAHTLHRKMTLSNTKKEFSVVWCPQSDPCSEEQFVPLGWDDGDRRRTPVYS